MRRLSLLLALALALATGPLTADEVAPPREPLLPLSPAAAQVGVIVTVAGREIHLYRPDGSETKLLGRLPVDASPRGDRRPLIINDEAYLPTSDLDSLLPERHRLAVRLTGSGEATPSAFSTFEVRKPVVSSPAPVVETPPARVLLPPATPPAEKQTEWADAVPVSFSLSMSDLVRTDDGAFRGTVAETTGLTPRTLPDRRRLLDPRSAIGSELSYLWFESQEDGRRQIAGDFCDPLFGFGTGITMFTPQAGGTRLGASLFVPSAAGASGEGRVAAQAQHQAGPLRTDLELAADGSYRTFLSWDRPSASIFSSVAELSGSRSLQLGWRESFGRALNAYAWSVSQHGLTEVEADIAGVRWNLGHAYLGADLLRRADADETATSRTLTLGFNRPGLDGALRYTLPSDGTVRPGVGVSLCTWGDDRPQVLLDSPAPEFGARRTYWLGLRSPAGTALRAQASFNVGRSGAAPECMLSWQPSSDQVVSLRYGRLDPLGENEAASPRAVILQMRLTFGGSADSIGRTGTLSGRLRDTLGQPVPGVAVSLDGAAKAVTDGEGRFAFEQVPGGEHDVILPPDLLPVDFSVALPRHHVYVTPGAVATCDFLLTRLCRISGRVTVSSPGSEVSDGLAGLTVQLDTGQTTVTDELGRYQFTALPSGRYTVSCRVSSDSPGLLPQAPEKWEFALKFGDQAASADFRFLRQERAIKFNTL